MDYLSLNITQTASGHQTKEKVYFQIVLGRVQGEERGYSPLKQLQPHFCLLLPCFHTGKIKDFVFFVPLSAHLMFLDSPLFHMLFFIYHFRGFFGAVEMKIKHVLLNHRSSRLLSDSVA